MRGGEAGRANPRMCIQERLLGASRAREGVWGVSGHAHMMNSRALSMGARRPGKGRVGRAVCTSEAMEACDVGCAREGLGGRMRRYAYMKGC